MKQNQAQISITSVGGASLSLDWLLGLTVPAGVNVVVADFGYRVNIDVTLDAQTVTLVADLSTGDAAQATDLPGDSPLLAFARLFLARRMAMVAAALGDTGAPTTPMRDLIDAVGATWIATDMSDLTVEGERQPSRTEADE